MGKSTGPGPRTDGALSYKVWRKKKMLSCFENKLHWLQVNGVGESKAGLVLG